MPCLLAILATAVPFLRSVKRIFRKLVRSFPVRRVRLLADLKAPLPFFDAGRPRFGFPLTLISFSEIEIIRRSFAICRGSSVIFANLQFIVSSVV